MLGLSLGLAFGGLGLGPEGCGCGLVGIVLASVDVKLLLLVFSLYVIIIKQTIASGQPLTSDDADNTCTPPLSGINSAVATCCLGLGTCGLVDITASYLRSHRH